MSIKNVFKQNLIRYSFTTKKHCYEVNAANYSEVEELLDKVAEKLATEDVIILFDGSAYSDRTCIEVAEKIKFLSEEYDSIFLIRSRADIAYLIGADGVCLNVDDLTPLQAHEIVGEKVLIGIEGADFDSSKYPVDYKIHDGLLSTNVIDNRIPVRKL